MLKNKLLQTLLLPVSWVYGLAIWVRNNLFDMGILRTQTFKMPIISIGNITVGGTGKTPHTEYLIQLLKPNHKVAVLSRGYKRLTSGFVEAAENSEATEIGDEPRQIKQKFPDVHVVVDANRVHGIQLLMDLYPDLDAILLDDAFQHRYVQAGLSILLVDYNRPIDEDFLLPAGNLREPEYARFRAHIIIVTKCPKVIKPIEQRIVQKKLNIRPYQSLFFTTVRYGEPKPVFNNSGEAPTLQQIKDQQASVLLVTGIASPAPLVEMLENNCSVADHMHFPDHYSFKPKDLGDIIARFNTIDATHKYIITTEKDAQRLHAFTELDEATRNVMYYLPVEVYFLENEHHFHELITRYVDNNKRNNILYKK